MAHDAADDQSADAPGSTSNAEVARRFAEIGDILEIKGEPPYRYNAYRTAARSVGNATERLETLFAQGRLRSLRGIGSSLEARIIEYLGTGRMEYYERVRRDFPVALASLLEIPGLGPNRARAVFQELGVTSLADLEAAARGGQLRDVSGFGPKAIETLLANLDRLKQRTSRSLLSDAFAGFTQLRDAVGEPDPSETFTVVGSVRRMQDAVGGLDVLAARETPEAAERLVETIARLPNLVQVIDRSSDEIHVQIYGGLEVRVTVVPREAWGSALLWQTGSRAHIARLTELAAAQGWRLTAFGLEDDATGKLLARDTEAAIYERLGLPWIAPELREDAGEIEAGLAGTLPRLIQLDDLKGDLHTHTNWTDGADTLEDMAAAAKARGYQYMALTDHTQNLTLTRGLTPERLEEERALVRRVNQKLAPFVVLLGTEMDILLDGQLDFDDALLETLDYVSASVHSGFRQPGGVMTARMQRAIANPLVHTLNHPHGRKIGRRDGYAVDMQAVVDDAARLGCALEINATPDRLDLPGTWARRARALGARLTISSDAHSTSDFDNLPYGVGTARRGWVTAADVLNARPLAELQALLGARRVR